jgi:transposase
MSKKNQKRRSDMLPVLHPDAAGVVIGAEELFVAEPADRYSQLVRRFSTFTRDLLALAEWLKKCRIRAVTMESTSVYWIPLYQILETHGFECSW